MPFDYYDRLPARKKAIYRRSDEAVLPTVEDPAPIREAVRALGEALEGGKTRAVRAAAGRVAARVVEAYGCGPVEVAVKARRPKSASGELYGLYEWEVEGGAPRIQLWMRTAERREVVTFKAFVRTFAHELCHHLDVSLFGLAETFHTEGFFRRESALVRVLLPSARRPRAEVPEPEGPSQLPLFRDRDPAPTAGARGPRPRGPRS